MPTAAEAAAYAGRPFRGCDVCGQCDRHPRHVYGVGPDHPDAVPSDEFMAALLERLPNGTPPADVASAVKGLLDPFTLIRHMDCCAAAGCPDGTCVARLEQVGDLRGDKLVRHLEAETAAMTAAAEQA